jgi:hypothetical protein
VRSCVETLEPGRYGPGSANALFVSTRLRFPQLVGGHDPIESCVLVDGSPSPTGRAVLGLQEAALLEGRTELRTLPAGRLLVEAVESARRSEAAVLHGVVSWSDANGACSPPADRLPGLWIAVVPDAAPVAHGFDAVVVARRSPTAEAGRVFRMLAALLARETRSGIDAEDFIDPLRGDGTCRLLDGFTLPGSDDVRFPTEADAACCARATGIVVVDAMHRAEKLAASRGRILSIGRRAPDGCALTYFQTVAQRAEAEATAIRPIDILVAEARRPGDAVPQPLTASGR